MKYLITPFAILVSLALASPTVADLIANEDFDSDSNLIGFVTSANVPAGGFSSPADGFQEYTRLVSATIPFNISDDSVTGGAAGSGNFSDDSNGFLGNEKNNDTVFGITDTWNPESGNSEVTGTWSFDISGATGAGPLQVHIDMAAFNDFAGSTVNSNVDFFYQIDGGGYQSLFTSSIIFGGSRTYTMDDGDMFTYDDPLNMTSIDGTLYELNEDFQTVIGTLAGLGSTLDIQVRVNMDGSESFGLDNIRVYQVPEPGGVAVIGLLGLAFAVRRKRQS